MFLIALTGGIASGKSAVSAFVRQNNVPVIDADDVAREVVKPGSNGWKKIKKNFGADIVETNGEINRGKLGEIIFANPEKRKILNNITHPLILRNIAFKCLLYLLKREPFVVLDLPLFYESGKMKPLIHKVIVASCSSEIQRERLMQRNGYTLEEANLRIESQMPLTKKCKLADYVINNNSNLEDLEKQVNYIMNELKLSKFHLKIRFLCLSVISAVIFTTSLLIFKLK